MKIGDLAKATNTLPETVRFYEREGLLPSPAGGDRFSNSFAIWTIAWVLIQSAVSSMPSCRSGVFRRHKENVFLCVVRDSKKYLARIQLLPAVEHLVIHTHRPSPGPPPATRLKEANRESGESIRRND
jgi:MerR family regulatory protein